MRVASAEALKQTVFDLVAECKTRLQEGKADLAGVEDGVRAYCEALASLPKSEAQRHVADLTAMMREVAQLGDELRATRTLVHKELHSLDHAKRAHVAYRKSDAISDKRGPDKSEEPE